MRQPSHPVMAEHRAEDKLNIQDGDGNDCQSEQSWPLVIGDSPLYFQHPFPVGKERDAHCDTKERLCQGCVRGTA